jgi:hypothetical protein
MSEEQSIKSSSESLKEESSSSISMEQEEESNPSSPPSPMIQSQVIQGSQLSIMSNPNPPVTSTSGEVAMPDGTKIQVHA